MHQRGGAWGREIGRTRSAFRVTAARGPRENVAGFRVACDPVP